MKNPNRILFLPNNVIGVNYWRMGCFANRINRIKGVEAALYTRGFTKNTVGEWEREFIVNPKIREEIYSLLKMCDLAIFQFTANPWIYSLIGLFQDTFKLSTLCEIDDYVLDTPTYSPAYKGGFKHGSQAEWNITEHLKLAKAIIVSTDYLKECYKPFNKNIFVVPNCIDFQRWDKVVSIKNLGSRIRIGWAGGANHEDDLDILVPVIPIVLEKRKDVEFYFVHGVSTKIRELSKRYNRIKWTHKWEHIDKYHHFISNFRFDVGLAPIVDSRFNRAKSNLRWLEYSALKIPTIAADIEPYKKAIKSGETGILVKSTDEWVSAILDLVDNETKRRKIGLSAYTEVKKNWNLDIIAPKYYTQLRSFL